MIHETKHSFWPFIVAGILITCLVVWLGFQVRTGLLTNTDELATAERSREMLLLGRTVVHYNLQPSFTKPPLQYWLTSLTLPRFQNREFAVRMWPAIYGALTAIALAGLTFAVDPKRPWLTPLSVALFVSYPLFLAETVSGLLDAGLTFFTISAILFAQLARRKPIWWFAVGAICALGTLQKIPLLFLVWLIIVLVRASSPFDRASLRSGWLVTSFILALAASAVWPLLQSWKHGAPPMAAFSFNEMNILTGPSRLGARTYFEIPYRLSIAWVCGSLALLAPFVVLWRKKNSSPAISEIAILSLTVIALAIVCNFRSVRYVMPIVPCLCLLLAIVVHDLCASRRVARSIAAIVVMILLGEGLFAAQMRINHRRRNAIDQQQVAEKLGELQEAGTKIVLIRADDGPVLYESFYLFYGNLRAPVAERTVETLRQNPPELPAIGACRAQDFAVVQETCPGAVIELQRGDFICWRAPKA
jgi:4-amino-4-deoxy-L-arabinose transferase-like glycosyltransferase